MKGSLEPQTGLSIEPLPFSGYPFRAFPTRVQNAPTSCRDLTWPDPEFPQIIPNIPRQFWSPKACAPLNGSGNGRGRVDATHVARLCAHAPTQMTHMPSLKLLTLMCQKQGSLRHQCVICMSQRQTYSPFGSSHLKVPEKLLSGRDAHRTLEIYKAGIPRVVFRYHLQQNHPLFRIPFKNFPCSGH